MEPLRQPLDGNKPQESSHLVINPSPAIRSHDDVEMSLPGTMPHQSCFRRWCRWWVIALIVACVVGVIVVVAVVVVNQLKASQQCVAGCATLVAPPPGTPHRLVVHPSPIGGVGVAYRNVQSSLYGVEVELSSTATSNLAVEYTATGGSTAFVYDVPNTVPVVEGVGASTHFTMFDIDPNTPVEVTITMLDASLIPVTSVAVTPDRYGATAHIVAGRTDQVVVELKQPGHYYVNVNGFDASHDTPLFLFVEQPEGDIIVASHTTLAVPTAGQPNVQYFERGFHQVGSQIQVPAGGTVYLAPGAFVNASINAPDARQVVIRGRGVLSGEALKVVNQVTSKDRQPDPYRYNGINFGTEGSSSVHDWSVVEGVTVIYPPGYSTNLISSPGPTHVLQFKAVAYRFSSDGIALSHCGCAHRNFLKVNDDSLNAGWASNTVYKDIVMWPGDNSAVMQLSWGAGPSETFHNITFQRLDVVGRAGTVGWARDNQLGSSSLIAVTQMRGAILKDITIDDVVVYDDMPTLLGVSINVGDPQFGAHYPGGVPLGRLQNWRVSNLSFRAEETGVGWRQPPSFDQIPLIQTGQPIKSWVYFQQSARSDGSVVDISFENLSVGSPATCVSSTSQWPGIQIVGPAQLTFTCP